MQDHLVWLLLVAEDPKHFRHLHADLVLEVSVEVALLLVGIGHHGKVPPCLHPFRILQHDGGGLALCTGGILHIDQRGVRERAAFQHLAGVANHSTTQSRREPFGGDVRQRARPRRLWRYALLRCCRRRHGRRRRGACGTAAAARSAAGAGARSTLMLGLPSGVVTVVVTVVVVDMAAGVGLGIPRLG